MALAEVHAFAGIWVKLDRAKENIGNLDGEISTFFEKGDYPILPEDDSQILLQAIEYHKNRVIPPRFAVLAGEIIHHLRSCFDHIVWNFSVAPIKNPRKIEFPVFEEAPVNRDGRKLFEGKIEGITNPKIVDLIKRLQPHVAPDPFDDPLFIIHSLDILDKHKKLILCASTGGRVVPISMRSVIESYQREHPELSAGQITHHFKGYGALVPCISFKDFGGRKLIAVVPGLTDLFNYTVNVVNGFAALA